MILLQLHHRPDPADHHWLPFRTVSRQRLLNADLMPADAIPHSVRFHIVLGDHVDAEDIAEPVEHRGIRIVAGPDRIDMVLLHDDDCPENFIRIGLSACVTGEFVPVDTAKDNPFSIQAHQSVFHLKVSEADKLPDSLEQLTILFQCERQPV